MDFGTVFKVFILLDKHRVQSMVVGGMAVAFYGHFRLSTDLAGKIVDKPDIDIWYNPTYENYYKMLHVIDELGKDVTRYKEEITPDPKNSFFRLDFEEFSLDLLPRIKANLKFSDSFARREIFESNGLEIPFIGRDDLIRDKEISPRPKDIDDIEHLMKK